MAEQNLFRWWMFLVELRQECGNQFWGLESPTVFREICTVPEISTGSEEKNLDTGLPAFSV
jgi:hypothetical protein